MIKDFSAILLCKPDLGNPFLDFNPFFHFGHRVGHVFCLDYMVIDLPLEGFLSFFRPLSL